MGEQITRPEEGQQRVAARMLHEAAQIVSVDRQADHGEAERSFDTISQFWSTYLGHRVEPVQVAMMMALLKIARQQQNPGHHDNYLDLAGYAGLGAELSD